MIPGKFEKDSNRGKHRFSKRQRYYLKFGTQEKSSIKKDFIDLIIFSFQIDLRDTNKSEV